MSMFCVSKAWWVWVPVCMCVCVCACVRVCVRVCVCVCVFRIVSTDKIMRFIIILLYYY